MVGPLAQQIAVGGLFEIKAAGDFGHMNLGEPSVRFTNVSNILPQATLTRFRHGQG